MMQYAGAVPMDEAKYIPRTEHRADLDREVATLNKSIDRLDRDVREGFQEMRVWFRWMVGLATPCALTAIGLAFKFFL